MTHLDVGGDDMNDMEVALPEEFLRPDYSGAWLGGVLPAVARSIGIECGARDDTAAELADQLAFPEAQHAVVVLIDGLGARQLRRWGGHAPFLRTLRAAAQLSEGLPCAFPSTTATSTASLGTGLAAGLHGLVGWQTRDPDTAVVFNHLSWEGGPDPRQWQPYPTIFEQITAGGGRAVQISQPAFEHSGLTRAALRGTQYRPATSLGERVSATLDAVRAAGAPTLAYCYIGEVDKAGHVFGPGSLEWGQALEEVDAAVAAIASGLPPGVSLTVTADHGMVDAPQSSRIDLSWYPELTSGISGLGGEPRGPQLYTDPGAQTDVRQVWTEFLGDRAVVLSRAEAIDLGLFGVVHPEVAPRIGDLLALMRGQATVVHSAVMRPQVLALIGHHGSLTPEEMLVPLLHHPS